MKIQSTANVTAIMLASVSVQGAAVIYEPFNQAPGALNGQPTGNGLAGNWFQNQNANVVAPPTLNYGDLANTGGQLNIANGNGTDISATLSSDLANAGLLDNGATLWFSFVANRGATSNSNEWSGFALGTDRLDAAFNGINMTSSGNGLGINTRGGVFNPTTWEGGGNGAISAGINFTLNTDFFIVGKFDWGATSGDVDTVTLYNPALNDLTNLGTGFSRSTSAGVDQTAFDTLSISIRNSGGANIYDEIRFGATLDDVTPIPEASSLALLGLGGILVARRRRA